MSSTYFEPEGSFSGRPVDEHIKNLKIKTINLENVHFVGLYRIIILQSTVQ
jgi:hypothetical protein